MYITQRDQYDIIAVRMPLLDHYVYYRLLCQADYLQTYLLSESNSTHYFYRPNYFVWEKNKKRNRLGLISMHEAAKYGFPDFLFIKPTTFVFIFLCCHYSYPSTESDRWTEGRMRQLNVCISVTMSWMWYARTVVSEDKAKYLY